MESLVGKRSVAYLAFIFVLSASAVWGQSAPIFSSASLSPGVTPHQVLLRDINGDGSLDAIVKDQWQFSVCFGDGQGGFGIPTICGATQSYTVGGYFGPVTYTVLLSEMFSDDVNADGKSDVILDLHYVVTAGVPLYMTNSFSEIDLFLGGVGSVSAGSLIYGFGLAGSAPGPPIGNLITSGHLNTDLGADLVYALSNPGPFGTSTQAQVSVQINGSGSLFPGTLGSIGWNSAIGDINGDGLNDIVGAAGTSLAAALGNGLGGFGPLGHFTTPNPAAAVDLSDITGDGLQDVVECGGSQVSVFQGQPFGILTKIVDLPLPGSTTLVRLCDINADGSLDIVGNVGSPSLLYVSLNNGTGAFGQPVMYGNLNDIHGIDVGDLNGDGIPDILANDSTGVVVLLNQGPVGALVSYGTGTPGCNGLELLTANKAPKINTSTFELICTAAPPNSTGLFMIANVPDQNGSDMFGLGAILHLDLVQSGLLLAFNATSDSQGLAHCGVPIPNDPTLSGLALSAQALWVWPLNVCFNFPYGISTSNGLAITILP